MPISAGPIRRSPHAQLSDANRANRERDPVMRCGRWLLVGGELVGEVGDLADADAESGGDAAHGGPGWIGA